MLTLREYKVKYKVMVQLPPVPSLMNCELVWCIQVLMTLNWREYGRVQQSFD